MRGAASCPNFELRAHVRARFTPLTTQRVCLGSPGFVVKTDGRNVERSRAARQPLLAATDHARMARRAQLIFDAILCERSERADKMLNKFFTLPGLQCAAWPSGPGLGVLLKTYHNVFNFRCILHYKVHYKRNANVTLNIAKPV